MRSSTGFGVEDIGLRGSGGFLGGISGKTGVRPVDTGEGGVGGRGSTKAAEVQWVRSWSSSSSSGVERTRSSVGWVAVGVCSSGVEDLDLDSWLDQNPNQVGFGGFLQEMVANYYGDSRDKKKLDLLLRLVWIGPNVALEEVSKVQSTDDSQVKGVEVPTIVGSRVRGTDDSRVKGSKHRQ